MLSSSSSSSSSTSGVSECSDGQFIGDLPICDPSPCAGRPPWIRKGRVIFDSQRHGSVARYECDSGYALSIPEVGDNEVDTGNGVETGPTPAPTPPPAFLESVVCERGEWRGVVPECVPKLCPYPGSLENGEIYLVGML